MKSSKLYIFSDLTIFLVAFVCGFIHPEVAFKWHFFFPTMVLSVLIIILVAIVRFLISVVKRSNITNRLVKLILAVSLFFALAWGRNLVFYGTVVHYKIVNSYQNVIDWAETVNLQEFDLIRHTISEILY